MSMMYRRDASWHPYGKAMGGTNWPRFHAPRDEDVCLSACSRLIMLHEGTGEEAIALEEWRVCGKPACRRFWQAARTKP